MFALNTNGSGFATLHSFTATDANGNNSDGAKPYAGLTLSGNTLFGTAKAGGTNGDGSVFSIYLGWAVTTTSLPNGTNGVAYNQTLAAFGGQPPYAWTNISGTLPPGLTLATNGVISGTPTNNGTFNFTVRVTDANNNTVTQALKLTVVTPPPQVATVTLPNGLTSVAYSQQLSAISGQPPYSWSLFSGSLPSGLALATNGLISGTPTVAEISSFTVAVTDSLSATGTMPLSLTISTSNNVSVFTPLYSFADSGDGEYPSAGLILSGNTLYGTAFGGGANNYGNVFAINTNGTSFTNLYSFTGGNNGQYPDAGVILSGNTLYGSTYYGGTNDNGTIFAVNTNGIGFTNLYSFTGGNDGENPQAGLILSGNTLYGTTSDGGTYNRWHGVRRQHQWHGLYEPA